MKGTGSSSVFTYLNRRLCNTTWPRGYWDRFPPTLTYRRPLQWCKTPVNTFLEVEKVPYGLYTEKFFRSKIYDWVSFVFVFEIWFVCNHILLVTGVEAGRLWSTSTTLVFPDVGPVKNLPLKISFRSIVRSRKLDWERRFLVILLETGFCHFRLDLTFDFHLFLGRQKVLNRGNTALNW